MGLFDKVKRAMGFDAYSDDDMEIEGIDATVTPLRERMRQLPAEADEADSSDCAGQQKEAAGSGSETAPQPEQELPDTSVIFEQVIRVFNASLPDFLQRSVDPEKERRELYRTLDGSVKNYFERYEKNVEHAVRQRFQADTVRLQQQIESLEQKARKEEEETTNSKNLQLSAERQKRALSERVHELEKQLASLEAENEQFQLENKTMANKLRVLSVTGSDRMDDVESGLAEKIAELQGQIDTLQSENSRLRTEAETAVDQQKFQEALEQAKAKDELSRAMVNDLNVKLAKAREDLQVVREVQEQIARLEEEHKTLEEERKNDEAELRRQKDELMEKEEQMRAREAEFESVNAALKMKDETIRRLEDQTDSLRKSVESLQYEKTQTETTLMSEIARLKSLKGVRTLTDTTVETHASASESITSSPAAADTTAMDSNLTQTPAPESDLPELVMDRAEADVKPRPRRGRPPRQALSADYAEGVTAPAAVTAEEPAADGLDFLDSTDWLIASPGEVKQEKRRGRPRKKPDTADDDFGYKEPVRQDPPDNPAQMLLF